MAEESQRRSPSTGPRASAKSTNATSTNSNRDLALDISHRYKLADLARARIFARRLYLSALARRASMSHQAMMLDTDYIPEVDEVPLPYSSYLLDYIPEDELIPSRPSLPSIPTRVMYNRRLAELEAERLESVENADRILSRYVTRSRSKSRATPPAARNNDDNDNQDDKEDVDEEEERQLLREELEAGYIDVLRPLDLAYPDFMPRLRSYRRRNPFYRRRFHPLGVTTRLMERRLNN